LKMKRLTYIEHISVITPYLMLLSILFDMNWSTSSLFWDVTQQRFVVRYRRFGRNLLPHLQGSSGSLLTAAGGIEMSNRNVGN
jgi:hypothetical protein